jgi:hypothetical protein
MFLIGVVLSLLIGCVPLVGPGSIERGSATLEDAVYQSLACQPPRNDLAAFGIRDQRVFKEGVLALYTAQCHEQGRAVPMVGYAFVTQQRTGWSVISSSYSGVRTPQTPEDMVMTGQGDIEGRVIKYGRVLHGEIARITLVLEDGRVVQDRPRNEMFVLEVPRASRSCELRLFDAQGQILQRHLLQMTDSCS